MTANRPGMRPVALRLKSAEHMVILMIGDFFASIMGLFTALIFWSQPDWYRFSLQFLQERIPYWFYFLPVIWMIFLVEIYEVHRATRIKDTLRTIGFAAGASTLFYLLIFFLSEPGSLPRRGVAAFIIVTAILTIAWRWIYIRIFTAPVFSRRYLIIGAGRAGTTMASVVRQMKPAPFTLVGIIDDDPQKVGTEIEGYRVLGSSDQLLSIIQEQGVSDLIFAISNDFTPQLFEVCMKAEEDGVLVTSMPVAYEDILHRVPIFLLQSDWILRSFIDQAHTSGVYEFIKRLIDIIGGFMGTMAFIVMLPFISIAILLDSGAPIFYTQKRLGKSGKEYKIFKFRTMRQDAEKDGQARVTIENDSRITRVGLFLRKSHLDEFPQFVNVLFGEMSLVGPRAERPELMKNLEVSVPFYRARLLVKPGVTGWAQVNFGYASTVEASAIKMEYDLYYIKHRNLFLDLTIILRTIGSVIGFKGQ